VGREGLKMAADRQPAKKPLRSSARPAQHSAETEVELAAEAKQMVVAGGTQ